MLLRHFVMTSFFKNKCYYVSSAWNPRVLMETGGREERLKPTGGESNPRANPAPRDATWGM